MIGWNMNWRRGLIRLWIVSSLCWIGFVGWTAYAQESERAAQEFADNVCMEWKRREGANPFDCFDTPSGPFHTLPVRPVFGKAWVKHYASIAFLPPLGVLIAGVLVLWIAAGFRKAPE
jgi:hypothetical protein